MKKKVMMMVATCVLPSIVMAQSISGEYTGEWAWGMSTGRTNFVNHLRFDFEWSPWEGGTLEAATQHIAVAHSAGPGPVIDDMQLYSNVYEENNIAAIAILGYKHAWEHFDVFFGVRNLNEDFFTSEAASLFTSSSPGIFPTISASYPIANYPVSSLNITFNIMFGNWKITNALYNGVGYCGWKHNDNPFRVDKRDGIFDELQVAYETEKSFYSVGAGMHTKEFTFDDEGDEMSRKSRFSAALWAYGEQDVWEGADDQRVRLMAQASMNTNSRSACTSYFEIGGFYQYKSNTFGLSAQYGRFHEQSLTVDEDVSSPLGYETVGTDEWSLELTWHHEFTEHISVQPAFHFVNTGGENNTVLLGRFIYSF